MDDQRQQIIEKLQAANNILVTVTSNPSVDQLAACIGLTLLLNKLNKHATAVFSGAVPSTIEFLRPEDTLEKNTDSLRDFIIALDKSKADKLRYKVEDEVVKIFITPYKSSITEKDLIFSQGDFNVDVVMALGVHQQTDLDTAILAHGRILHDAVVISVNNTPNADLGVINWQNLEASGLSEIIAGLANDLGQNLLDNQIATALLTGIVAETAHFSNQKTTPQTMTMSAALLAAGANQQLVASQLKEHTDLAVADAPEKEDVPAPKKPNPDGALKVEHKDDEDDEDSVEDAEKEEAEVETPKPTPADPVTPIEPSAPIITLPELEAKEAPLTKHTPKDESIENLIQQADTELQERVKAPKVVQPLKHDEPTVAPLPATPVVTPAPAPTPEPPKPAEPIVLPPLPATDQGSAPTLTPVAPPANAPMPMPEPQAAPAQPAAPVEPTSVEPAPAELPKLDDVIAAPGPGLPPVPPTPTLAVDTDKTLTDLEESISSPHVTSDTEVDSARKAVEDALSGSAPVPAEPLAALNAVPVNLDLGHDAPAAPGIPAMPPAPSLPDYLQTPGMASPAPTAPPPMPTSLNIPPPASMSPTATTTPLQGPPPPPMPPPITPGQ